VEPAAAGRLRWCSCRSKKGRPVGIRIARDSAILVADDVGNVIWRV
jgi:glucose/arabinose dehydrogenase